MELSTCSQESVRSKETNDSCVEKLDAQLSTLNRKLIEEEACSPSQGKNPETFEEKKNFKEKIQHFIGMSAQAPDYLRDNAYIFTGYRINFHSPKAVLKSMFLKHNELFNIWSHFLGFVGIVLVIVFLACRIIPASHQLSSIANYSPECTNCTYSPPVNQFSALLGKLPDLDKLEEKWKDKIEETRKEFRQFKEAYTHDLSSRILKAILDAEAFVNQNIQDATPASIKNFLKNTENEIHHIADAYADWKARIGDSFTDMIAAIHISNESQILKTKLSQAQQVISNIFYEKLESKDYDWIDVYKYIDHRDHSIPPLQSVPRWPIFVFLFSAAICLLGSTIFHAAYCMSFQIQEVVKRLDYAGISILITGSCFPPMVYGFYCQQELAIVYLTILSIASLIVFFVTLGEKIHEEKNRHIKGGMFAGLGLFSGLPIIHLVYNEFQIGPDTDYLPFTHSVPYYLAMGACYLVGLVIFVTRIPEKYIPGKVDNCGHSHNFWHVLVLMGIVLHYFACFENYYTRMEIACRV